jgi:Cu+-exporting ATPase
MTHEPLATGCSLSASDARKETSMARDPVCNMEVNPDEAIDHDEYKGTTYYFCSVDCAEKFESDPERYAGHASGGELENPPETSVA